MSSSLTIGIDARSATEVGAGRGRVVRELLRALAVREHDDNRYVLYARQAWTDPALESAPKGRFRWKLIDARNPFWHLLSARAASRECDVFLSANSYLTTWFAGIPTVPIVFDLVTFEPAMQPNRVSAVIERIALPPAVRRASGFLAISQATADALTKRFPAAAGRTTVALLGVTPALSEGLDAGEAATLPPPGFVLSVGTLEPRKNLPRLVAAFRELDVDLQKAHPLVVVGAVGWQTGETLAALRSLGDRCVMLGRVSDAALAELYRRCAVFCYPSLGEGFGLPVLEAMAAGAAVLTSNTSSLPEVGGDAVAYADPYDVQEIGAQLETLLRSPARRAELGQLARERSEQFSWERFAEIVLEALAGTVRGKAEPARARMRIFVLNPSYPPVVCGVGAYTRGLATALVRAGHDVTVITCAASTPIADGPPRVLPLLREWGLIAFLRAWPRFPRPRPDLVVSCYPAAFDGSHSALYLVPGLAKVLLGRPRTVFIAHEFVRAGGIEQRLLRLPLWAADRIVAVTEAERDAIVARYPSVAARTVVRHNPPTIPVAPADPETDARTRTALASRERPLIGFIGLLRGSSKGFEELLEALARTDAVLVATGSLDPANAYHEHIATLVERLGLGERVRWLGFVSDDEAARLLRAVDAVALPYRGGAESGYTSLLAALVNGAAVITTRGPQNPPWLQDGETALLVDREDPAALAKAITRLTTDDRLAAYVRAGALALSFGWEELVEAVTATPGTTVAAVPSATAAR